MPCGDGGVVGLATASGAPVGALGCRRQLGVELPVQGAAQEDQGLGAHLGDAGLRDAELLGDLGHRSLGEEVLLHDRAQSLRELGDRLDHVGELLTVLDHLVR